MTQGQVLSPGQLDRVRAAAATLLPGSPQSPAARALPDFDALVQQGAVALGRTSPALAVAIDRLPAEPSWENLSAFAEHDPASFELVALLVVGSYFMSASVLASLGRPAGERRPAHREQVVDELSTGILDPVLDRGSPVRTLHEVDRGARTESKGTR
jgi:hypothetical protein